MCLYYARFWQPEKEDKSTSGFTPQTDELVKQQASKEKQRKLIRRSAVAGLVLIPLLSLTGFGYWQHLQSQPSKGILILVADFDGPEPQKYGVSELIRENLRSATKAYDDVKVKPLGRVIKESEGKEVAKEEGKKRKAAIVIWGWYHQPKTDLLVNTHFQLLKPIDYLSELNKGVSDSRRLSLAELESFNVKIRPASQMSYLTLVTLGMSRSAAKDWDGAIQRFDAALRQTQEPMTGLSQAGVYFYRAGSYYYKKDYKQAIDDLTKSLDLGSRYAAIYSNRGSAKAKLGDKQGTIQDYTQAIQLAPEFTAYNNRGNVKADMGDKEGAIQDFDQAIQLNPKGAVTYFNRGHTKAELDDKQGAIQDYDQVIYLAPEFALAYYSRGNAKAALGDNKGAITDYDQAITLINQTITLVPPVAWVYQARGSAYYFRQNYDQALKDHTEAIKLEPNFALAYLDRGINYRVRGNKNAAVKDFQKVLELTQDPDLRKKAEQELQKLGVR